MDQMKMWTIFIPEEMDEIKEGYYSQNEFVQLLRDFSKKPDVVSFLADMLEF